MKNILAIIPARAGSKRILNKNSKVLCGKPLVLWTLDEAVKSKYIDWRVVSTNSYEIMMMVGKYFHLRPKELATDEATTEDVILEVLNSNVHTGYKYFILLQPTSPTRTVNDIDRAIETLLANHALSLISVENGKPNGAIYMCDTKAFLKIKNLKTDKHINFPMNNCPDIDTQSDWEQAEKILNERKTNRRI